MGRLFCLLPDRLCVQDLLAFCWRSTRVWRSCCSPGELVPCGCASLPGISFDEVGGLACPRATIVFFLLQRCVCSLGISCCEVGSMQVFSEAHAVSGGSTSLPS